MRWLVVSVAIAACYRSHAPGSCVATCAADNDCPAGLQCLGNLCRAAGDDCSDAGLPIDAAGDSIDAAPSMCTSSASWSFTKIGTLSGVNYTLDAKETFAIFADTNADIKTVPPNSSSAVQVFSDNTLSAPHLAADGGEIFMLHMMGAGQYEFVVSKLNVGVWQSPTSITMLDTDGSQLTIESTDRPGNVTARAFGARHMMAFMFSGTRLVEFQEQAPGVWKRIDSYAPADLGATAFNEANLTDDGLHMTYVADIPNTAAVYSNRSAMNARFGNYSFVFSGASMIPHSPYMTRACDQLFVTIQFGGTFPINVGHR